MKHFLSAVFGAGLLLAAVAGVNAGEAPPRDQGPVYIATYFEVANNGTASTIANLKEYRDATRKEAGALQSEIFQETGAPTRFVTFDQWRDWAAYDAHAAGQVKNALYEKQRTLQWGPPDVRMHLPYFGAGETAPIGPDNVIILSHLDVAPMGIPRLLEIMKPLSENSAKDQGMIRYQLVRQTPGAGNHYRVFEVWTNEQAFERHNAQGHVATFRTDLLSLLGTPYDQRKYKIVQ